MDISHLEHKTTVLRIEYLKRITVISYYELYKFDKLAAQNILKKQSPFLPQ